MLNLYFIFQLVFSPAYADTLACVAGNPNQGFHAQQLLEKSNPPAFLSYFQNNGSDPMCLPDDGASGVQPALSLARGSKLEIRKECIEESMKDLPHTEKTNRALCSHDESAATRRRMSGRNDLCVSPDMVDYVHWSVNSALECVNSIIDEPLDPLILFKKINRESKFGYYLQSDRGVGIGQLTSIAVEEMTSPRHRGHQYKARALNSEKCRPFHNALSYSNYLSSLNGQSVARICPITNPQEGLARNLFLSLSLFAHNRDTHGSSISKYAKQNGLNNSGKINYLTLVSYGRNGNARAKAIFNELKKTHGITKLEAMPLNQFVDELRKLSPYVNEVEGSYKNLERKIADKNKGTEVVQCFGVTSL